MTTRQIEDYDTVEPDWYDAVCTALDEGPEGQWGPTVEFVFDVMTGDGVTEMTALASDKWKGDTKARRLVATIVGRLLAKGEDVNWNEVEGKPVRVNVSVVEDKKGLTRNRITEVAPPRRQKPGGLTAADAEALPF